jgi:hypothetical protein
VEQNVLFSFLQVLSFIIASSSFLNTAHLLVEKQSGKEAGFFVGFQEGNIDLLTIKTPTLNFVFTGVL